MFRSNLTTEIKLEEGTYTVIAHFRWFESNGTQHDMARQQDVKRRPPLCGALEYLGACAFSGRARGHRLSTGWLDIPTGGRPEWARWPHSRVLELAASHCYTRSLSESRRAPFGLSFGLSCCLMKMRAIP